MGGRIPHQGWNVASQGRSRQNDPNKLHLPHRQVRQTSQNRYPQRQLQGAAHSKKRRVRAQENVRRRHRSLQHQGPARHTLRTPKHANPHRSTPFHLSQHPTDTARSRGQGPHRQELLHPNHAIPSTKHHAPRCLPSHGAAHQTIQSCQNHRGNAYHVQGGDRLRHPSNKQGLVQGYHAQAVRTGRISNHQSRGKEGGDRGPKRDRHGGYVCLISAYGTYACATIHRSQTRTVQETGTGSSYGDAIVPGMLVDDDAREQNWRQRRNVFGGLAVFGEEHCAEGGED
mmetsp:Transcript_48689/g.72263  ORF Transcript_48689/g.72263 Transcript_48689/m.72263 type:complete len:285 (+) Transcript_48689:1275-2129(+)